MTARPGRYLLLCSLLLALASLAPADSMHGELAFTGDDSQITLNGPYASARVLVEERFPARVQDVTKTVALQVADPRVARIEDGTVLPVADGSTMLTVRQQDRFLQIPVYVRQVNGAKPPRFITEVLPVLTKAGCNQGGCHGAASGKGGFKLSLQGYDPEADYESITRANGARRLTPAQPENSLLLRKPTMAVLHRGGKALDVGSPGYRLLVDWIAGGMPGPEPNEPSVTGLEVVPPTRSLPVGGQQRFRVWARFTDGTRRDVTAETLFSGSDSSVASVTPEGQATVTGKGEAALLVRYRDLVATASVVSPFAAPLKTVPYGSTPIDRIVNRKLAVLGLEPSPRCSDEDFLRRTYLDMIGTLPKPDTVRTFLADSTPNKREKLVDSLFQRPEYVDYWTLRWGDILRSTRTALGEKGLVAFNHYLRQSVAQNRPWNQMARDLVLARGSMFEEGPTNYYRAAETPESLAETTAQVFMGVRMQCARCHNHPFERWKQNQYYQLAAFYARVRTKPGQTADERIVYTVTSGEVTNPRTKKVTAPAALDAPAIDANSTADRRQALADWLTGPKNPFFARILVNRLWKHFMGQGLVEPVDDMRVTNPPTNQALLDYLAQDFVQSGYDIQRMMRSILLSDTYQRTVLPTPGNSNDTHYYSHYLFKRVPAEPLLDAVGVATGVPEKFGGYPVGMRAAELPDTTAQSYFLDLFGRPARSIVCQCERLEAPNLSQILHFMNGKDINSRLMSKDGRIAKLMGAKTPDDKIIEELYLATLSRYPTEDESWEAVMSLTRSKDKQKATEDLLWALLNTKEFLFNH